MAKAATKKAPVKRKSGGGAKSLAAAKARVAKLESQQKRATAIKTAEAKVKSARAELAKARKIK